MSKDREMLSRIADVLGCPVEAFLGQDPYPAELGSIGELLRIWIALEGPEDRARLLVFARTLTRQPLGR